MGKVLGTRLIRLRKVLGTRLITWRKVLGTRLIRLRKVLGTRLVKRRKYWERGWLEEERFLHQLFKLREHFTFCNFFSQTLFLLFLRLFISKSQSICWQKNEEKILSFQKLSTLINKQKHSFGKSFFLRWQTWCITFPFKSILNVFFFAKYFSMKHVFCRNCA